MDRRAFIGRVAGGVLATPLSARAQRQALPTVGFLRTTPAGPFADLVTVRQGLNETGFVEGQNVAVEYRWADNPPEHIVKRECTRAGLSRVPSVPKCRCCSRRNSSWLSI
jgi:hypothetical protein